MPAVNIVIESKVSTSVRARQVGAMFDAPVHEKCRLEWKLNLPIEDGEGEPWNVGLVVGPSGSGKSTVLKNVWGALPELAWKSVSVVDDFAATLKMDRIAEACSAVGFNTIPAWMRPYQVLSNGERFRVDLARRLLELPDPVVVDEFTSVVDRQVAQIGAHAVQKYVRRNKRKFVAVGCHYDVIDWLQPDWVLDMATRSFTRRSLQRRPTVDVVVGRVPYSAWSLFAPFHYMSAALHKGAKCFGLWANNKLAAFVGILHMPHPRVRDIMRVSRTVTLPDWQGLGLNMALVDTLGSAYRAVGKRLHHYPAHPSLIRTLDRSEKWSLKKPPGRFGSARGTTTTGRFGERTCAVFEFIGSAMPLREAQNLLAS